VERPRPGPGEELNAGRETTPRPASTVILLRGGSEQLEVLLVRRSPHARFMAGAWVFPGGAVAREDGTGQEGHRMAAVRELREEAGITVEAPERLLAFARWITPAEVKIRYDTWFYLAPAPPGAEPEVDGAEVVEARWYAPREALAAGERGELFLVFPTIKTLEQLAGFASADALLAHAAGREVVAIQPRVVKSGEMARIVLPGEPGY
jgi:8-oxo-dGTP pyrophosphatase MutT (NUDIX family)